MRTLDAGKTEDECSRFLGNIGNDQPNHMDVRIARIVSKVG
jgi:hypothetical protein